MRHFSILIFAACVISSQASAQIAVNGESFSDVALSRQLSAPAEVLTRNHAVIAAETDAVIVKVNVDVGQSVNKGDVLLELDPEDYRLRLRQAEASLASVDAQIEQAESRLRRAQELSGKNFVSADDLLARETDLSVLKAQRRSQQASVAVARRELDKTTITAPFNGVVTRRVAQVGSFANRGTPLLDFVEVERHELEAEVAVDLADSLEQAAGLMFVTGQNSYAVEMLRLSPVIETERRAYIARLGFVDIAAPIGASGELNWQLDGAWLPADFVSRRNGGYGVFVYRDGIAEFIELPQAQEGRPARVDIAPDTILITLGRERLQPGDRVNLAN